MSLAILDRYAVWFALMLVFCCTGEKGLEKSTPQVSEQTRTEPVSQAPSPASSSREGMAFSKQQIKMPLDETLLIGLRTKDDTLHTVLVGKNGFTRLTDGVLVGREDGKATAASDKWRLVDVISLKNDKLNIDLKSVRAWKVGDERPKLTIPQDYAELFRDADPDMKEMFFEHRDVSLLFVGKNYYAVEESGAAYSGGAHDARWTRLSVRQLGDQPPQGERASQGERAISIKTLFGNKGLDLLKSRGLKKQGDPEKTCLGEPDENNWGIIRSGGNWVVRAGLQHAMEICRDKHLYYSLGLVAPASLSGVPPFESKWKIFKGNDTGLRDAIVSDSGRLMVRVYPDGLTASIDGEVTARYEAASPAVVMTTRSPDLPATVLKTLKE